MIQPFVLGKVRDSNPRLEQLERNLLRTVETYRRGLHTARRDKNLAAAKTYAAAFVSTAGALKNIDGHYTDNVVRKIAESTTLDDVVRLTYRF